MARQPNNYREVWFNINGKDIKIGGMARDSLVSPQMISWLKEHHYTDIISLYYLEMIDDAMEKENIRYHNFHMKDFNPPEPEHYDAIWNKVKELVTDGKVIGIHCGSGDGRTGAALASIKIRADLERFVIEDPEKITRFSDQKTSTVSVTLGGKTVLVECTPTVKEAVELIRKTRDEGGLIEPGFGDNGSGSVETKKDIEQLCLYEAWVIEKLKPTAAAKSTKQTIEAESRGALSRRV